MLHFGRKDDVALHANRRAGEEVRNFLVIFDVRVIDDLDVLKARSIIEGDEADGTRIAVGTNPTFEEHFA